VTPDLSPASVITFHLLSKIWTPLTNNKGKTMDKKFKALDKQSAKNNPGTHLVRIEGKKNKHNKPVISVAQVRNKIR